MKHTQVTVASIFVPCLLLVVAVVGNAALNTARLAPPRFDGAGYAVLAEALLTGQGYREINAPNAPRHDHFPPGYPSTLAILWWFTGRSVTAAHFLSIFSTTIAVLLAWTWFRIIYPPASALILGLALALNWTWGRVGGSIQSEPLFILWEQIVVLVSLKAARTGGVAAGLALGVALATSMMIRHVGACLAIATLIDLGLRQRWKTFSTAGLTTGMLIFPWITWLALVDRHSQARLLVYDGLALQLASQAVFYLQRIPDQIVGPFVEVGTMLHRGLWLTMVANFWAVTVTVLVIHGWVRTLQIPRRRLIGMIAFTTLGLLLMWPFSEAGRFLVPLVPFVLVGLTEGLGHAFARAGLRQGRQWAVAFVFVASVPYSAYSIINGRAAAQCHSYANFDTACQWIARHGTRSGPILTHHAGEVFWQTGRQAIEPDSADSKAIEQLISRLGVSYLLIDEDRYINAGLSTLSQYAARHTNQLEVVWGKEHRCQILVPNRKL